MQPAFQFSRLVPPTQPPTLNHVSERLERMTVLPRRKVAAKGTNKADCRGSSLGPMGAHTRRSRTTPTPAPSRPLHSPIRSLDQGGVQLLYAADGKTYKEKLLRDSASPGQEPQPCGSHRRDDPPPLRPRPAPRPKLQAEQQAKGPEGSSS